MFNYVNSMSSSELHVYNTLTRKKELFEPIHSPHVGMYVCGPTVYGDAHLGHAKSYVSFDVILYFGSDRAAPRNAINDYWTNFNEID